MKSQALVDPEDPSTVVGGTDLTEFITVPLNNPEVEGHCFADGNFSKIGTESFARFISAVMPEVVPPFPQKREVDRQGRLDGPAFYNNEPIAEDEYERCRNQSCDKACRFAVDLLGDPSVLVGRMYYCTVTGGVDKDGKYRNKQRGYYAEPPAFAYPVETENFLDEVPPVL